jgi:hypothetical protein
LTLTLAEGLIDSLNTYITANIVAKLAALDAEYTDTIVLTAPVATYVGIKSLISIAEYPALCIISPDQTFQPRSATGGASKPTVFMGIVEQDQDSEALQRKLYRYGRALVELALAASPGSIAGWAIATDEEWQIDTQSGLFTDTNQTTATSDVWLRVRAYAWEE